MGYIYHRAYSTDIECVAMSGKSESDGKSKVVSVCIKVWPTTKFALEKAKLHFRETFDDVINRLLSGKLKKS